MPRVEQIDIKAIFERAAGHKVSSLGTTHAPIAFSKPPIAGNLNTK